MLKNIGIVIVCFIANLAIAQSPGLINYSISDGLPSAEIYEVHQDLKGFLWFGSDNGVIKFDGKEMKTFHAKEGLSDPVVFGFSEDSKGRLWFRTYSGKVSYYDHGKIHRYRYNDILEKACAQTLLNALYYDDLDQLWFASGITIGKIDAHGQLEVTTVSKHMLEVKSLGNHHLIAFYGPPQRIKYIRIENNLYPIQLSDSLGVYSVFHAETWRENLYITIGHDIFEYDGVSIKKVFTSKSQIISLSKDLENNLWVGYLNQGVEKFKTSDFKDPEYKSLFENKSVTKVLQDHEGGYWFTTLESGAYYAPNISIKNFQLPITTKIKTALSHKNKILIGDQRGIVHMFGASGIKEGWSSENSSTILSIFRDSEKKIWVSTILYLNIFDSLFHHVKTINKCKSDFSEDREGNIWSIGGTQLTKFDKDGNKFFDKLGHIYRAVHCHDSLLLLTGRTGLEILSLKSLNIISKCPALSNFKITDMISLSDSTIILATTGNGFFLMNPYTLKYIQYNSEHNFSANSIYALHQTDSLLWMGTEHGLVVTNINRLLNGNPTFHTLSKKSGLTSDKINFIASSDSTIWALTEDGVSIIPKAIAKFANNKPLFYLKDVLINRKNIDALMYSDLPYDQNNISLSFGFISFNNNDNITLRFKLSSTDPWTYSTGRNIEFHSLASGSYTLTLEFSVDNAHWHPAISKMNFTIHAPWWKTWYAQLGMLAILVLLGYIYFRNRLALTQQKQKYLEIIYQHQQKLLQTEIQTTERERSRIAKDLHDTVGTNLVALKMIIGQILQKHQEASADHVENQLQHIIHEIKEIIHNLTPPGIERYGLFVLLKNQVDRFSKATTTIINLALYGNDVHHKTLNLVILRILQELITNSLKHAHAKSINIHINTFEDRINIIYEDNGIGFSYNDRLQGFGLHNIESRIESVSGQVKFESGEFGISYNIDIPFPKMQ